MKKSNKVKFILLISRNYHIGIKKIQVYAKQYQVGEYVDPNQALKTSHKEKPLTASDYLMTMNDENNPRRRITRKTLSLKELFDVQKKEHKANVQKYLMMNKFISETLNDIRKVHYAVKTSARQYLPANEITSARQMIKTLIARYKLSDDKIVQQIHEQGRTLKQLPVKSKDEIEGGIVEGENLRL